MLRNRDQYTAETKQRLMSRLGQLAEYTQVQGNGVIQRPSHRGRASTGTMGTMGAMGAMGAGFNGGGQEYNGGNVMIGTHVRPTQIVYNVRTLILDSNLRNFQYDVNANDFVIHLPDALRKVAVIRILRTEFYQSAETMGYFVLNDVRIPLQTSTIEHAYLALNEYAKLTIGNGAANVNVLGRIGPGSEIFPAPAADVMQDPFAYVFRPIEPKLQRFHVRLLNHDGSLYGVNGARVVLTLAAYCLK